MQVTFDTNVWNRMVFLERHVNSANYLFVTSTFGTF